MSHQPPADTATCLHNLQNVGDHVAGKHGVVVVVGVIGQHEAQLLGVLDVAGQFEFIDFIAAMNQSEFG